MTLYEDISLVAELIPRLGVYEPGSVAISENQGITKYMTRLFSQCLTGPDIIVLTNTRQDRTDTFGKTRTDLVCPFARSVPTGTHVVNGEQHPVLREYVQKETEHREGTIEQVDIPDKHRGLIGSETIHAVDTVLDIVDEPSLPVGEIESSPNTIRPTWVEPKDGLIFNAVEMNDIENTEMVRRMLADDECIIPFVYLRRDRRGRTVLFVRYIELLFERELVDEAHIDGTNAYAFAGNVDVPIKCRSQNTDLEQVLAGLFTGDRPVVLMGNMVDEFMHEMQVSIEQRAEERRQVISASKAVDISEQGNVEASRPKDHE